MKITYYGHSCFAATLGGQRVLFDPFITQNELARDIDAGKIEADFILISHAHFDHIDDAVPIARRTGAKVISNYEIVNWLEKQGLENLHPLNHGGQHTFGFGTAKYVNAIHTSSFPDGTYGGNPGGFVIESEEGTFYYSGDTALTLDMELIGQGPKLDFAVLCIGDNFTMGVSDAIRACDFIRCDTVMGVHYDTFPPIEIDHEDAKAKFTASGKTLHLLEIGATAEF